MPQPIAYLAFDGNCAEAMRFYEKVLRGKLEMMLTNAESPMADMMPKEAGHRIMHAALALDGDGHLYAGDCPPGMPYQGIHGVMLALSYDSVAEATRVFNELAAGGRVTMPLAPSFWAKAFGMVTDRFGTSWGINGEPIPPTA